MSHCSKHESRSGLGNLEHFGSDLENLAHVESQQKYACAHEIIIQHAIVRK